MPQKKQPCHLKKICLDKIYLYFEFYWLARNGNIIKQITEGSKLPRYFIGPFTSLDDREVEALIKRFYKNNKLTKFHLMFLLHNRLKTLDFSFIKKSNLITGNLCEYLGYNCDGLTELNLFAQSHLTSKNLCDILHSMKNLRRLNLAHTQASLNVAEQISKTCLKLVHLNLESCSRIYDDCILEIISKLHNTLEYLNIDYNDTLTEDFVRKLLIKYKKLRCLKAPYLIKIINRLVIESDGSFETLNIENIQVEYNITLKREMMESLAMTCLKLKSFTAYCAAERDSLGEFGAFNQLTELVLGNNSCLMSFKFKGHLLETLRNGLGRQLRTLQLISIVDVNLKSIILYCTRLNKLNVEIIGNYDPAEDNYLDENNNEIVSQPNRYLKHLSVSKTFNKYEEAPLNAWLLKSHLNLILSAGSVNMLELIGLSELDDTFFVSLFSTPTLESFRDEGKLAYQTVEVLELKNLNNISPELIDVYLLNCKKNKIKSINLEGCKKIKKADYQRFLKDVFIEMSKL